jgi:DNA-directed RNA polymerase specialized sigma24 family protein
MEMRFTKVGPMDSTDPFGRRTDALRRLLELWQDPQVRGYAWRRAGDRDLADDALQTTYYLMARLKHLAEIENLKAYFYQVLRHEIDRQRGELRAGLVEDPSRPAENCQPGARAQDKSPPAFEDAVCVSVLFRHLHKRLVSRREELLATVPARSADPGRYRAVIYAAACQILSDGGKGEVSEADSNEALQASYPEYFAQPGASANTCHQRCLRARADVRKLLQALISGGWSL